MNCFKDSSHNLVTGALVIVFLWLMLSISMAEAKQELISVDALSIMEEVDSQKRKISDSVYTKSQLSSCKYGRSEKRILCSEVPRVKVMESVSLQYGERKRDSKNISIILEPARERGIGMLTYRYDRHDVDTESWLYLNSLGKIKRVAGGDEDEQEPAAFFGSEFTTEDLENGKTDKYSYKILQEGKYFGRDVWVIEGIPKKEHLKFTSYSKSLFWVDKERKVVLKVQTYDKHGQLYKRLQFRNLREIDGLWLSQDVTVLNFKTNRLSNMNTLDISLNVEIEKELLTQRALVDVAFRNKGLSEIRKIKSPH